MEHKKIKSICYFGRYNPDYARNRIIIKGLKENGCEILECRTEFTGAKGYYDLFKKFNLIRKKCDIVIVAYPGHTYVWLVRLLTLKPVIFDAFISIYDSFALDRKLCSQKGLKAFYYRFLDKYSCLLVNTVLLDTDAHIDFFVKEYKLSKEKFVRVFIGADDSIFFPCERRKDNNKFIVHFHGTYVPLQGIEYVVRAAKLLEKHEDIKINLIGAGQESQEIQELSNKLCIRNINFVGRRVSMEEVAQYMSSADICLGLFGGTQKTLRVISNKVYEGIAMKKPMITSDTPAIREVFSDYGDIILCKTANPEDLAKKILLLKNDSLLRNKIAENGFKLFREKLNPQAVTQSVVSVLEKI